MTLTRHLMRRSALALAVSCAMSTASAEITSANRDVLALNTGVSNPAGVTLNGMNFVVHGLQGVGRLAASTTQSFGGLTETLGSISDMQISKWSRNSETGEYFGVFNILPDRGFNAGTTFSNYAARINNFNFSFTPYTGNAPTTNQNQITLTYSNSSRFTYDHDGNPATAPVLTTGLVANSAATSLFGQPVPTVTSNTTIGTDGPLANRLTLDSEGLILDHRAGKEGEGWIGDEYGAFIYHFDANKVIDGIVTIPQALVPHRPAGGPTYFTDAPANADGRRINQGMEGIAISPDGTRLFAMLQSATIQDSATGNQGRTTTRVLVYDISGGAETASDPIDQYVVQLPRIDSDLNGSLDRAGAQSGIIALDNQRLLILSRDGNGRGANTLSPVFKSVLLADLSTGTDIDGQFDAAGARVTVGANSDVLPSSITAVEWKEALNMLGRVDLGITELEQFGLNLAGNDINTLSEKWEGMALVPTLDGNLNDYFLFLGNDNDFQTATGFLTLADGSTLNYDAGLENDTMILAYRVTIQPVPLPAALCMFAPALAGLATFRRRS